MKAEFNGRLQFFTTGRLTDLIKGYDLACNPKITIDSELMFLKNSIHQKAKDKQDELKILGTAAGMIINIAGSDPIDVPPERILEDNVSTAHFIIPQLNSHSYFTRFVTWKNLLIKNKIPAEKIDFMPKYVSSMYPTVGKLFDLPSEEDSFQYLGLESDHHFDRINKESNNNPNKIILYHDFRNHLSEAQRNTQIALDFDSLNNQEFNLYVKRFTIADDGSYGAAVERSLDVMLENSVKHNIDSVLAIACYPLQADRARAEKNWKKPFAEVMQNTPFKRYMLLKEYLINKGADLNHAHITFCPPDTFYEITPSRTDSYLPKKFIFFTEEANGDKIIARKNEQFGKHQYCVGVEKTNNTLISVN
ncbi:hypothetical protein COV13_00805 [Candidatus Woesearchaeota archaeon CG10_big_fil_rev_8_21_14_0_10_32_9]|nr:MAG: hypothetical protein COV13_00805 [Candidatus Woesearchaeota archaeon CG10_big_fil_rev_8_21_14_0_10_32_9]